MQQVELYLAQQIGHRLIGGEDLDGKIWRSAIKEVARQMLTRDVANIWNEDSLPARRAENAAELCGNSPKLGSAQEIQVQEPDGAGPTTVCGLRSVFC